jgi:hypothetical protein
MGAKRIGIALVLLLGVVGAAPAQQSAQPVDVSRLPIDVERIQEQLQHAYTETEEHRGLNLRYQIEVFGRAPRIDLFTAEDNLVNGPVPYGAPTHREMIEHVTPQEFRSPVMDFSALFRWLADKAKGSQVR